MRYLRQDCTLHEVIEGSVYPYRCHRCGGCFLCQHYLLGYRYWVCRTWLLWPVARTVVSPGVRVRNAPDNSHRAKSLGNPAK